MAVDAQTALLGYSKGAILSCMGAPERQAEADGIEVWSYSSVTGPTSSIVTDSLIIPTGGGNCIANLQFENGKVVALNYLGNTGEWLAEYELCAPLVEGCMR